MYDEFKGRSAIVTGGGSGLGRAICKRLAREGVNIAVADINLKGAEETVEQLAEYGVKAIAVECDVTKEAAVEAMAKTASETFGKIDFLVNNAGMSIEARQQMYITQTPEEIWDKSLGVNLKSVFLCSKHVIPYMQKEQYGRIVNISSIASYFTAFGASYAAAKAGVLQLTASIALQYANDNVRCNCVCPGAMVTPTGINANKIGTVYTNMPRMRMVERVADPMEMANAVAFFLSDESCYIDGTYLKVDGGTVAMSARIPESCYKPEE